MKLLFVLCHVVSLYKLLLVVASSSRTDMRVFSKTDKKTLNFTLLLIFHTSDLLAGGDLRQDASTLFTK